MDPSGGDWRYLQQLGNKLLNNQRWSLMNNADNNEMFEDMGVSLLEDNNVDKSVVKELIDPIQNIENRSPNVQRCLKRSHSKANLSDSKSSPLREMEFNASKSSPSRLVNQSLISSSFNNTIDSQMTSTGGIENSENNLDILSPTKISKVCPNKKLCIAREVTNNESSTIYKISNTAVDGMAHSSKINLDAIQIASLESIHSKIDQDSSSKWANNESLIDKCNQSELAHISPLTTCGPHPPFHKYPKFISRHSTFDDGTVTDGKDSALIKIKMESDDNFNQTIDEIEDGDSVRSSDICNEIYFKENCEISSKIVNQNKQSAQSDDCATVVNAHTPQEVIEKECFVSQNLSFCESCEKKGVPTSIECTAACRENENGFSKLFDEIVLTIFQWLPKKMLVRCMLVCKRWNKLALDSRLWARVSLGGRVLKSGVLPNLMDRHPIVLRLANAHLISPVIPDESVIMKWRVQFLDLSAASITPECLGSILHRCPALLRLSLEGLALSESACHALGKLINLKVLNLALVTGLGHSGAIALSSLPKLVALNVAWTGLESDVISKLCEGLPISLQRLNLSGFRKTLTEKNVEVVVKRCPNIVELDLSDCVMLGEGLIPILLNLKYLEHLAISRCTRLKKPDFQLLNNFQALQWVDVFGLVAPATPISLSSLNTLIPKIRFNEFIHSAIARPTVGIRRSSIWGLRTKD